MELRNTRTTILNQGGSEEKREEIRQYFHATYTLDEELYQTLASEKAFYLRPEPLRHPLIFYFGHTATFYVNKLNVAKITNRRINPRFESMFAIGVDEMSWDDLNAANYDWPTVAEVKSYRDAVRAMVDEAIRTLPLAMPVDWDNPFWAFLMGIEHQRIPIETSSVIIRRLPIDIVRQLPQWEICPDRRRRPAERVSAGDGRAGRPWKGEGPSALRLGQRVRPPGERRLGLCRQSLPGVEPGVPGLRGRPRLRTRGTLDARRLEVDFLQQGTASLVLGRCAGRLSLPPMARVIDMPWDWPVEVNYLEAKAFCNWLARKTGKSLRLPTEAEWYRLRDLSALPDQPYWKKAPGNINLEHWASSCPVNCFRQGEFFDVVGNVWQWTETPITGFDGFQVHPYYDDFSTPTFDTQHNLIKGGSWISTGNEATRDSRYAFRRHFFQHAGLRYVESEQPLDVATAMYERDSAVSQYCEAHYGKTYFGVANFPACCAAICLPARPRPPARQGSGPRLRGGPRGL